jgi:hypothetical protein
MTEERRTEFDRGPRWLPWVIGVVAAVVYLATLQRQLFNDGIFFEFKMRFGGDQLFYKHVLYLPLAGLLQAVVSVVAPIDGEQALKMVAALAGGAGVALTFLVARDCLESVRRGVACAALLGTLAAYWFHSTATELHSLHAACTTLLLLALIRAMDRRHLGSIGSCLTLALGAALAPTSHLSGGCVGLPLVYVWFCAGSARTRYTISVVSGFLIFGVAYYAVALRGTGFSGDMSRYGGMQDVLWEDPAKVPHLLKISLAEFSLYSAPAAALIPAGLRVLFRTSPMHAWFCVCWMVAWPIVAWPVEDRLMGAYYVSTLPVQALLAIVAMHGACRTWGRAWLIAGLGILPLFVFVFSSLADVDQEMVGLLTLGGCAMAIFLMAGRTTGEPRGMWLLPIVAFVTTAPHIINVARLDPHRDRIAEVVEVLERVEEETGKRPLLIFLATNTATDHHWKHFFPGALDDVSRAFNPVKLAFRYESDELADERLDRYRKALNDALTDGRPVFMEGKRDFAFKIAAQNSSLPRMIKFFTELDTASFPEPGGLPDLLRLSPKR